MEKLMKLSFKFHNFWVNYDLAVGSFGVFVEIILMFLFGWVEGLERFYFSGNPFAP